MFFATCKNTCKNLVRTATFWLMIVMIFLVAVNHASRACYGVYLPEFDEVIMDTDPRFVLDYQKYIQHITNSLGTILSYGAPILAVVSTLLIACRDYGDCFFEIEKSAGLHYAKYLLGRLFPLIAVVFFSVIICSFFSLHLYVFSRGGVSGIGILDYLKDSAIRLLRANLARTLPCITVYITLTYCIATVFKSHMIASVAGLGYVISNMVLSMYFLTAESFYLNYLSPDPQKVMQYLYYYDTEWFGKIPILDVSVIEFLLCIGCGVLLSVLFSAYSFFCIRKRTI